MEQTAWVSAALSHWSAKRASRMGAAVAYYAIFSLIPMIVLLIILASTIFSHQIVIDNLGKHLSAAIGVGLSNYLLSIAAQFTPSHFNVWGAIVSIVVLLFTAIGVINETSTDLRELWNLDQQTHTTQDRFSTTVVRYISLQLRSALMIAFVALAIIASIVISTFGSPLISNLATFCLGIILCMLMYRTLSGTTLPFRDLFVGAVVTTLLFHIGKILISLYLAHTKTWTVFGTASSLIAIVVWVFYSSQVFFLSAAWMYVRFRNTFESPLSPHRRSQDGVSDALV